jgi:hypothetical protein
MKRGTTLLTLLAVTCGVLLGWLTASGKLATVFAQEVTTKPAQRPMTCDVSREVLPIPEPPFNGVINETATTSTKDFPEAVTPPQGRSERPAHHDRRCRLRRVVHIRRADSHSDLRQAGERRFAL